MARRIDYHNDPQAPKSRQDDRELLASLAVAGVEDYMLRVRVDADDAGDLTVDPGLFLGLANRGLADRFPEVDRPARDSPVLVVRTPDHQQFASIVDHDDIDRRDQVTGPHQRLPFRKRLAGHYLGFLLRQAQKMFRAVDAGD